MIWNYAARLRQEIMRWQETGLVSQTQAQALLSDVESSNPKRSFATVLALLGGVLVSFGLIAFVASNWESMPRYLRVLVLIAAIWTAYGIAIISHIRAHSYLTGTFIMIGIAAFGTSIMLIGQIYQLQGRNEDALLLWLIGGLITTLATRSTAAITVTLVITGMWIYAEYAALRDPASLLGLERFYWFAALWLILAAMTHWVGSRLAAHGLAVLIIYWFVFLIFTQNKPDLFVLTAIQSVALVMAALSLASLQTKMFLRGFEIAAIAYCFLVFIGLNQLLEWVGLLRSSTRLVPVSSWQLIWPLAAAIVTTGLALLLVRTGTRPIRDQIVIPFAALAMIITGLVIQNPESIGLLYAKIIIAAASVFYAIWAVRFGWRIESKTLSSIGYIGFIAVVLQTYSSLFNTLQLTAAVYTLAGLALIGGAIWLFKRENKQTTNKESDEGDTV